MQRCIVHIDRNIYGIVNKKESAEVMQDFKKIYTTNAIESLNSALRKVTRGKGSFINKEALFKVLYLRVKSLQNKWAKGIANWPNVKLELIEIFDERYLKYL